jgi:hypothetical protein
MRGQNTMRAERYRELAVAEQDREKSALLNRLAEEAERGVLCTAHRLDHIHLAYTAGGDSQRPFIDVGDVRLGFL